MNKKHTAYTALFAVLATATCAWADNFRADMEAANSEWLRAYNTRLGAAVFSELYTKDALVLPPNEKPVVGAEAIGKYWAEIAKDAGIKNHTFEIVSIEHDGNHAYQVSRWALDVVNGKGETTKVGGNTVRIFERQPNGKWLIKVHIYNRA